MREGLANLESKMVQLSDKLDELVRLERQFREMVNNLKCELLKDVQNVRLPGITVSESGTFVVVKKSVLSSRNWSPRYYIPREQAKAVVSAWEHCTTVDGICKKIGFLLTKK